MTWSLPFDASMEWKKGQENTSNCTQLDKCVAATDFVCIFACDVFNDKNCNVFALGHD